MPDNIIQTPEVTSEPPVAYRNRSPEIKDLACALAKAQGAMENAEKSAENPAFKRDGKASTYATLASVWTAIRKPLADNGLAVMQWPRTVDGGVEIETELLHETGQFMRDILWLPCPQMTVHTVGSTITYGRRYALMAIVGIAPEDDDGNAAAEGHKPGAPGTAGAGGDFRPPGPRRFTPPPAQQSSANGRRLAADDPHLIDNSRDKGSLKPNGAGKDALQHMAWIKDARKIIAEATTKDSLSQWWRESKEDREAAESAVPAEFDKLIVAFDAKMDDVARAGA